MDALGQIEYVSITKHLLLPFAIIYVVVQVIAFMITGWPSAEKEMEGYMCRDRYVEDEDGNMSHTIEKIKISDGSLLDGFRECTEEDVESAVFGKKIALFLIPLILAITFSFIWYKLNFAVTNPKTAMGFMAVKSLTK